MVHCPVQLYANYIVRHDGICKSFSPANLEEEDIEITLCCSCRSERGEGGNLNNFIVVRNQTSPLFD